MSKFDEKYVQFLKDHEDDFAKGGFKFTTVLNAYFEWIEGNALCDCGHGCRDTIADNGAKLVGIMRSMQQGLSPMSLDLLALKDPVAFMADLHEDMWIRATNRATAKDASKS